MTTRAEIRASLRLRLEDGDVAPLWDDSVLNDAIATAIGVYGGAFPRQVTTGLTLTAGSTRVDSPVPIDGRRVARVIDALGILVTPWPLDLEHGSSQLRGQGQAWRWWGDTLILAEPVAASAAGIWTIEHLAGRQLPAADGDELDVLPGDEPILLALAESTALSRRASEDAKRGLTSDAGVRASAARSEADRLVAQRKRRARG